MPGDLKKLLYVEDDESIAEIALMTLRELGGFEVMHCSSGQAALDCVAAFKPQMILMDVMMPDMDGPETLKRLKAMPAATNIPLLFITAKAQLHEQKAYIELGAAGVIVKPFDPATLSDQIRAIWNQPPTDAQNPAYV